MTTELAYLIGLGIGVLLGFGFGLSYVAKIIKDIDKT